ncbi:hypothetical protein [Piscinibacter sp.]|uniref:hypothetical protein n=1 Tax=Piscinibacter sp. TaxID=1903157 RepID=UPI002C73DAD3|nr:hypothetical protein [Albitalea sp.]HUG26017.1 hypothetical protein [Albitalea sp.]
MFTLDGGTQLKALQASDIAFEPGPDGSMLARVDQLSIRHVRLQTALAAVSVSKLALTRAVIRVAASASRPSVEVLGLSADEIRLEGVDVTMGHPPHAHVATRVEWRLEPLTGLEGQLQVFIRDCQVGRRCSAGPAPRPPSQPRSKRTPRGSAEPRTHRPVAAASLSAFTR